jgi:hypothetical protein
LWNLVGTPLVESKPIQMVPKPNVFVELPALGDIIKVTFE